MFQNCTTVYWIIEYVLSDQTNVYFLYSFPSSAEFHCPTDWHINNDLCYYVTDTKVTWHQADDLCKQMNATLVTIKSEAEDSYVESKNITAVSFLWRSTRAVLSP